MRAGWRLASRAAKILAVLMLAGCAQRPGDTGAAPRGVLYVSTLSAAEDSHNLAMLRHTLAHAAARIGAVQVQARTLGDAGAGDNELAAALQAELRAARWDVIVTATMRLARLARAVDQVTPIVFEGAANPKSLCLVDSLERPGGNATGYTSWLPFAAKMVEALVDAYPATREIVILVDGAQPAPPPCSPHSAKAPGDTVASPVAMPRCVAGEASSPAAYSHLDVTAAVDSIHARGLRWRIVTLCTPQDLDDMPNRMELRAGTALLVPLHYLFYREPTRLVRAIGSMAVPAIYARHFFVEQGGLMSLAPTTQPADEARAYELAVRILAGEPPARLPVQTPEGFELRINTETARTQGLRPTVLALRRAHSLVP